MTTALKPGRTGTLAPALAVGVLVVAAWLAVVAGVVQAVLAATGSTLVEVPVRLTAAAPATSTATLPCVEGWTSPDGSTCRPAAPAEQWTGGVPLPVRHDGTLLASGSAAGPGTALLAAAPAWAGLVAGGLAGLALVPVLRGTASGRPFAPASVRGLGAAAAAVALGGTLAVVGPVLAAPAVLRGLEAGSGAAGTGGLPAGWLAPALPFTWWPLLVAALLAALAAAGRRGARLAADTEGLV